jgi:predicted transcriptional regulator
MDSVDLTPFGFTQTESLAYSTLLEMGPSSGYAVGGTLSIARANAYQALKGLVAKEAASVSGEDPQVYRPIRPDALLAKIARDEAAKLDELEGQMAALRTLTGDSATAHFAGEREFYAIALRVVTRESGGVHCVAPTTVLSALLPIWRKRQADGSESRIWALGDEPTTSFPIPIAGTVPLDRVVRHFGSPAVLLTAGEAAGMGRIHDGDLTGLWSSDATLVGATRAALEAVTA